MPRRTMAAPASDNSDNFSSRTRKPEGEGQGTEDHAGCGELDRAECFQGDFDPEELKPQTRARVAMKTAPLVEVRTYYLPRGARAKVLH